MRIVKYSKCSLEVLCIFFKYTRNMLNQCDQMATPARGLKLMTTVDDSIAPPLFPGPRPPPGRLSFFQFARALRDSTIATFALEAYEQDILERKMFGRRMFVVND